MSIVLCWRLKWKWNTTTDCKKWTWFIHLSAHDFMHKQLSGYDQRTNEQTYMQSKCTKWFSIKYLSIAPLTLHLLCALFNELNSYLIWCFTHLYFSLNDILLFFCQQYIVLHSNTFMFFTLFACYNFVIPFAITTVAYERNIILHLCTKIAFRFAHHKRNANFLMFSEMKVRIRLDFVH